jgi:hypothetical protein
MLAHASAAPNKHAINAAATNLKKCRIEFPLEMISTPNNLRIAAPENCTFSLDESTKVIVKIHPCL